jgi:hypothetical protein
VNVPDRYRSLGMYAECKGATVLEGVDSVTGLPVLIYRFEGSPLAKPDLIASEGIPTILWSGSDDGKGGMVAALAPGWRRRRTDEGPLAAQELLDAALAVRDAAAAGVAHGDLRPERLVSSGGRLQLEGFGVPWRPEPGPFTAPDATRVATAAGDVWSLAATVRSLGTTIRDDTISAVLELCEAPDPGARPTAEELYLALERLVPEAESSGPKAAESANPMRSSPDEPVAAVPDPAIPLTAAPRTTAPRAAVSSASDDSRGRPRPPSPHHGDPDGPASPDGGEGRRRLALLGVLMAAVIALALLAVYGPRGGRQATGREATVYVVEVFVAPEDLPPVTIHLLSSPPGSSLARGERLGTAPRHLALDRAGTWVFQGSLGTRRSEPVEIRLPEERSFTLTIPAAPGASP